MKVSALFPSPQEKIPFKENQRLHVPLQSGCYILSNLDEIILYIGLSHRLSDRFIQHLDTPDKTAPTTLGRAVWFHWLLYANFEKLERTWLNAHEIAEGRLPILNKYHSPISA